MHPELLGRVDQLPQAPGEAIVAIPANVAGALAYVLGALTGLLFLVLEPYRNDQLVRFHVLQLIFFCAACAIDGIAWNVFWGVLSAATGGVLALVSTPFSILILLAIIAYWIFVMYNAYANEWYEIAFIGRASPTELPTH